MNGYCEKLIDLGVPSIRMHVTQTAHRPDYGGLGFEWDCDVGPLRHEYNHVADNEVPEAWMQSSFYFMLRTECWEYQERLIEANAPSRFPILNEMREEGAADYYATALLSWMSNAPTGFAEADLTLIQKTLPILGLAQKSESNYRIAIDLLGVYLGKDADWRFLLRGNPAGLVAMDRCGDLLFRSRRVHIPSAAAPR